MGFLNRWDSEANKGTGNNQLFTGSLSMWMFWSKPVVLIISVGEIKVRGLPEKRSPDKAILANQVGIRFGEAAAKSLCRWKSWRLRRDGMMKEFIERDCDLMINFSEYLPSSFQPLCMVSLDLRRFINWLISSIFFQKLFLPEVPFSSPQS